MSAWPADKVCASCLNAGWVTINGALAKCPLCNGASIVARNSKAAVRAILAREHARQEPYRDPARPMPDLLRDEPTAPPPGFARTDVPIPTTVTEEQRERARARLAGAVKAIAGKAKEGGR